MHTVIFSYPKTSETTHKTQPMATDGDVIPANEAGVGTGASYAAELVTSAKIATIITATSIILY